jgi:hypothetical protein
LLITLISKMSIAELYLSDAADTDRKGKFAPLAAVVPRLGAGALLRLQPGLLQGVLAAMRSAATCSAAAQLWAALLAQLQTECRAAAEGAMLACADRPAACCYLDALQRLPAVTPGAAAPRQLQNNCLLINQWSCCQVCSQPCARRLRTAPPPSVVVEHSLLPQVQTMTRAAPRPGARTGSRRCWRRCAATCQLLL